MASFAAAAAPNEIKVFSDELALPGAHTLETHVNKAVPPEGGASRNPLRVMPEYSYGAAKNWELSLQLPFAAEPSGISVEGYRVEIQYVAAHDERQGFYWGFNAELARLERVGEQQIWNAELIPILGMRLERWHLIANPGFSLPLSGSSREVSFEPSLKVAYNTSAKNHVGVEYYLEGDPRSSTLYLAWDGKLGRSDVNIGVGRGFSDASDRWVLKMIYEFAF